MADICENIPQSSPDRQVNLVRSYCDAYDQMSKEELPKLTWKAKIDKLNEMAGVLRQIEEMQKSRITSAPNSGVETNNNIPFNVVSGYCDIDTIGGFADGRYSVINVFWPASTQSTPHYNDEKFLQEGFQRYDLHLKMDRKRNYFTTKPIYVRFEPNMTRLDLGFEGKIYSVIIPRDSVIREGVVTSLPKGGSIYRESTTISRQMTIDIWSTNAKLHLVIDVGVIR